VKLENKSISQLKKTAWKLCSEYNRQKDVDWRGNGKCCTCRKTIHWREGDAGHFMAGRRNAILFDDRGIHLQCKNCNRNQGEQYLYGKYMENRYGKEVTLEIEENRHKTKTITKKDYYKIISDYKSKLLTLSK